MVRIEDVEEATGGGDITTDYQGNTPDKSSTGGWLGAGLILGIELAERMCVMGISMNLVTYLVGDLHLSSSKSANIVTNFMGTLHLLAIVGGFLADAKLGRYTTIAIFATVTALGMGMLTAATSIPSMWPPVCDDARRQRKNCIPASGSQMALLYAALYTIALGGGSIKANVSGFGSDQFDSSDPKEEKAMIYFFNRFYFCISIGSLFAVSVLVYIQDNVARGAGYGISAGAMVLAVVVFFSGTMKYRYKKPKGSPLTVVWSVICLAWKKRKLPFPSDSSELCGFFDSEVTHTEKFRCLDKAAIVEVSSSSSPASLQAVNNCRTVTEVEEVKMIVKLLPVWSTCILFWTIYSQMITFSVEQATYTDRKITSSFVFPSGSVPVFLFLTILFFTSINEKVLVPLCRTYITHTVQGISSLQRIGIGLVFSILAMIVAGMVEAKRREAEIMTNTNISFFWLFPQFFLVGAGEAFAYVGMLEFFIREAPEKMKSMSTALFLIALAMGFFLSSLLVSLVDVASGGAWIRNNFNKGKLDYFYWMLAVLGVLNFGCFLILSIKHEYKVVVQQIKPQQKGCDGEVVELEEEEIKVCPRTNEGRIQVGAQSPLDF